MGFAQQVAQLFNAHVNSGNIRYRRWPATAAGVTVTADKANLYKFGAWKEVVAKATITNPSWLCAVAMEEVFGTDTINNYIIDVGTGEAGVEVSLSGTTGVTNFHRRITGAAGGFSAVPPANLPFPIRIASQPRLAVAMAQAQDAGADHTARIALFTAQAVGT